MSNDKKSASVIATLSQVELLLAKGMATEAMVLQVSLLTTLKDLRVEGGQWQVVAGEVCQRFAASWARGLAGNANLAKVDMGNLIRHLDVLQNLLVGTYSGSLDSYIAALLRIQNMQAKPNDLLRMTLAWTPNSAIGWFPMDHQDLFPELATATALATLGMPAQVTQEAATARAKAMKLLAASHDKAAVLAKNQPLRLLAKAWCHCEGDDNADMAREFIVQAMASAAALPVVEGLASEEQETGKPVLLVPLESGLGQFDLSERIARFAVPESGYQTVAVKLASDVEDAVLAPFDEVVDLQKSAGASPASLYRAFQALLDQRRPAALLLPDSGAPVWRVLLGRRRHAERQLACLDGRSAEQVNRSDLSEVDEWLVGEDVNLPVQPVDHVLFALSAERGFQALSCEQVRACQAAWQEEERFRVAVVAPAQQLQAGFIDALRALYQERGALLRFVFLIRGEHAVELQAAVHNLYRSLRAVECQVVVDKGGLLELLSCCHLRLYPGLQGSARQD